MEKTGISVDWKLRYSTIDERCQRVGQLSFIDLYRKGLIYRAEEPVLWDTRFQTALAQADLDTVVRKGKVFDIEFASKDGDPLVISTSRPELIPGCVALFFNPDDDRFKHLKGGEAIIPLFDHTVPILTSDTVDIEFGTGLMMVCTFGDGEDVKKWKDHQLATRVCIGSDGKMTSLAGEYEGFEIIEARAKIVKALKAEGLVKNEKSVKQNVSVGERSEEPVEFHMATQWYIKVLDQKEEFRQRADELSWFPEFRKSQLVSWIDGLKYDWNISRQRYYGVPFPVWYVKDQLGEVVDIVIADEKDLPIDPMESDPPSWAKEKFDGMTIEAETDVMDTWMTSSVSPLINADWISLDQDPGDSGIYPMSLRVQAHEIIRTWLFYTVVKSNYHSRSLPWKNLMISGWCLNEQGKKISKRSLVETADSFNRYNPDHLIEKYGADAVRYWAAGASLGQDLRFSEKEINRGRSIVTKLWNATRMAFRYIEKFDVKSDLVQYNRKTMEDQWIVHEVDMAIDKITKNLDEYDYAAARNTLDRLFYTTYCDNYLELVKLRFGEDSQWSDEELASTKSTLFEVTLTLLRLFAPFTPFVTEELYQSAAKFGEDYSSIHNSVWPEVREHEFSKSNEMEMILQAIAETRKLRSDLKVSGGVILESVNITAESADIEAVKSLEKSIVTAIRAKEIVVDSGVKFSVASINV